MEAGTKDAARLVHEPIEDVEALTLTEETQRLVDALSPTIGAELAGYVKDIGGDLTQSLRVSLAAANATLAVCAERIAQDTLLTHLSAATLN